MEEKRRRMVTASPNSREQQRKVETKAASFGEVRFAANRLSSSTQSQTCNHSSPFPLRSKDPTQWEGKGAARVGHLDFCSSSRRLQSVNLCARETSRWDSFWMRLAVVCCHSCLMDRIVQSFRKNMRTLPRKRKATVGKDATNKADEAVVVTHKRKAGEKVHLGFGE